MDSSSGLSFFREIIEISLSIIETLGPWGKYFTFFGAVLALCIGFVWLNRSHLEESYRNFFINKVFTIRIRRDFFYLALVLLSFTTTTSLILSNLDDFYVDGDSMSVQLRAFIQGGYRPQVWGGRFFPLAHADNFLIYWLGGDFSSIRAYLITHLALVMFVGYKAFDFVPINKRAIVLSLFVISPPIVQIYSSSVYSERNIILFLLVAFLIFRKSIGLPSHLRSFLPFALVLVFLAMFFKEPTVMAIATFAVLAYGFRVKAHNLSDQFSLPQLSGLFRSLEFLILCLCFLWFLAFFILGGKPHPNYVVRLALPFWDHVLQNWIEVTLIIGFAVFMLLRRKKDVYTILTVASLPMFFYVLFILRSTGAVNIYPYYNYLAYLAYLVYLTSLSPPAFSRASLATFLLFISLTGHGYQKFSQEVNDRALVFGHVIDLSRQKSVALHLDFRSKWAEEIVARYLLFRSERLRITHIDRPGHSRSLCGDSRLYTEEKTCTLVEVKPLVAYTLTDKDMPQHGEPTVSTSWLRLYKPGVSN